MSHYWMMKFPLLPTNNRLLKNWSSTHGKQKGSDKIGFKSRQDHTLDDVTSYLSEMNTPTTPRKQKHLYDKLCYIISKVGKAQHGDLVVIDYKAADELTPALILEGIARHGDRYHRRYDFRVLASIRL